MLKNFIIIIISIVLFDLVLRSSMLWGGQASAVYDENIGYWHKANFISKHTRLCYNNEYQFGQFGDIATQAEYNKELPNIVLLGNSYIEAAMVKNKNIVHNVLFNQLKGRYNVLNFGLYGSNMFQQALIYKYKVPHHQEAFTIQFVNFIQALDYIPTVSPPLSRQLAEGKIINGQLITTIKREDNALEIIRDWLGYTEYYEHILTSIATIKTFFQDDANGKVEAADEKQDGIIYKQDRTQKQWQQLKDEIKFMQKKSLARGSHYVAVVYSGNAFQKTNLVQKLLNWLKEENIDYLDLDAEMVAYHLKEYNFSCDHHWNDQVHISVGDILGKKINKIISNENN